MKIEETNTISSQFNSVVIRLAGKPIIIVRLVLLFKHHKVEKFLRHLQLSAQKRFAFVASILPEDVTAIESVVFLEHANYRFPFFHILSGNDEWGSLSCRRESTV